MDLLEGKLLVPDEFPFPYEAYKIQKDLMKQVYMSLDGGKLAILESPTGTVSLKLFK